MNAFLIGLTVIFLAELGDKTQVMALVLGSRYRFLPVFVGLLAANLTTQGVSAAVGTTLGQYLSEPLLTGLTGTVFIGFGIYVLIAGDEDGSTVETEAETSPGRSAWSVAGTVYGLILVSELGDKSMVGTMALATRYEAIGTWLGASVGMTLAGLLGVIAGAWLGYRLSSRWTRYLSSAVFIGFGLIVLLRPFLLG